MPTILALGRMARCCLLYGICAWLALMALPVHAEKAAEASFPLVIEPKNVSVTGVLGDQIQAEFSLRLPQPVTEVKLFGMSLMRSDRQEQMRLPIESISAQILPISTTPPPDDFQPLPLRVWQGGEEIQEFLVRLRIDLEQAPGSGEFSGNLHVRYGEREGFVNLVVKTKHGWPLPLFIIALGTVLGIFVTLYQNQGKPRDRVLVPLGRLSSEIEADRDNLPAAFRRHLENLQEDAETKLDDKDFRGAEGLLREAVEFWRKWRRSREDWRPLLEAHRQLMEQLQAAPRRAYVEILKEGVAKMREDLDESASPETFQTALKGLNEQWAAYQPLLELRKKLGENRRHANAEQISQINTWDTAFEQLRPHLPGGANFVAQTQTQMEKLAELKRNAEELIEATERQEAVSGTDALLGHKDLGDLSFEVKQPPAVLQIPSVRPLRTPAERSEEAKLANLRMLGFTVFSYAVTLVFLIGGGFEQLYASQPTFGVNPVQDYLGLFAWGFCAETARRSVTEVVGNWRASVDPGAAKPGGTK